MLLSSESNVFISYKTTKNKLEAVLTAWFNTRVSSPYNSDKSRSSIAFLLPIRIIIATFVPATKHHQLWTTKTTYNTLI